MKATWCRGCSWSMTTRMVRKLWQCSSRYGDTRCAPAMTALRLPDSSRSNVLGILPQAPAWGGTAYVVRRAAGARRPDEDHRLFLPPHGGRRAPLLAKTPQGAPRRLPQACPRPSDLDAGADA